jgi:hypothetical protein
MLAKAHSGYPASLAFLKWVTAMRLLLYEEHSSTENWQTYSVKELSPVSGFLEKMKYTTGIGLNEVELYNRAYEKGVLLKDFNKAADTFTDAARKYAEKGNQLLAAQAHANSMLYCYLAAGNASILPQLLQVLCGLPQIETIGERTMMPTAPLCAELDCRVVEARITQASADDISSLRDLHKRASEKFKAILGNPLFTYSYIRSGDGHDERADQRHFYHNGMYLYYEAMVKKDSDPSAASGELTRASQSFQLCNDQRWVQTVKALLENWRISRTCWICHREVQGYELHFSMCSATVTPYTKRLLEVLKQDTSTIDLDKKKIVVCTPCGSMVTFKAAEKAAEEADKVRQELTVKLNSARSSIVALESQVSSLERQLNSARSSIAALESRVSSLERHTHS